MVDSSGSPKEIMVIKAGVTRLRHLFGPKIFYDWENLFSGTVGTAGDTMKFSTGKD
jgi:hypothetical protein